MTLSELSPTLRTAMGWLEQRSERERWLIVVAGALAVCALFLALVWTPLQHARASARSEIAADEAVMTRLRTAGPTLAARSGVRRGPPASLVTSTAAEAGLTLRRLEPTGSGASVVLEDVEFDKLMRWLEGIERTTTLRISELKLDRRPPPGVVNAQITLVNP